MILLSLMLLWTSCKTTAIENNFPRPFDDDGNAYILYNEETKMVSMPIDYWIKITEYVIAEEEQK